jgi:quercetin dioxygenase-like cupin family protein
MMTSRVVPALVLLVVTGGPLYSQIGAVARYDINAMPWTDLSPRLRIRAVVGQIGSFAFGEFAAGSKTGLHHHTYEQANLVLDGSLDIHVAGSPQTLSALGGTLIPVDVEHVTVLGAEKATMLEFQPVRRLDWLPARTKVPLPSGPTAVPLQPAWQLSADFSTASAGWETLPNGARVKVLTGKMSALAVWEVPAAARDFFDLSLHVPGAEQFVYSVEGRVEAGQAKSRYPMVPGTLLVNAPDSRPLRVRATAPGRAVLVVFEATNIIPKN